MSKYIEKRLADGSEVHVHQMDTRYRVFIYTPDDRLRAHFWIDSLEELDSRVTSALTTPDPVTEAWRNERG